MTASSEYLNLTPRSAAQARADMAAAGARPVRIEDCLPEGKTYEEALTRATFRKLHLWSERDDLSEDAKLIELERFCVALCGGNTGAGANLCTDAVMA